MNPTDRLVAHAHALGLDLAAVLPAAPVDSRRYHDWLAHGYHGEMAYLARPDAVARRADPALILPDVRSIIVAGLNYHTRFPGWDRASPALYDDPSRGVIASYAWGEDYHDVLGSRLQALAAFVAAEHGAPAAWRAYVDTGPLLERQMAARASLGFIGKNTMLIRPDFGSWLFLGEVLTTVDLLPPTASAPNPSRWELAERPAGPAAGTGRRPRSWTCGKCTRCLDACPTNAFVAPYVLDAQRCISYLTIELKGSIPPELRPLMGNRIFGCDICQQVCPWNRRFARPTAEPAFQPGPDASVPPLLDLIALDDESFRRRFQHSPIKRAKRRGLLRNVAVALGNWGHPAAIPALTRALGDPEPLIREHAAWALERTQTSEPPA